MQIKSFQGGFDKNLSYLIWCESTRIACIVDASVVITDIIKCIGANDLILKKIFITHTHPDHIYYLDDIYKFFPNIKTYSFNKPEKKLGGNYIGLSHHEIIPFGTEMITVIYTPGHYPDSLCYWNRKEKCLFTGDTMFVGRSGRTVGVKSNISHLYTSIYNEILTLPGDTLIYPGHHYGYKAKLTIKENINLSSFFQCKSEKEFINVMKRYEESRRIE